MARRLRRDDELGPAVPRWATEFDPARWGNSIEGYGAWQTALIEWADEHLRARGQLGPWMDDVSHSLRLWPVDG